MAQAAPQTAQGCFVLPCYAPAVEAGGKNPESRITELASAWSEPKDAPNYARFSWGRNKLCVSAARARNH